MKYLKAFLVDIALIILVFSVFNYFSRRQVFQNGVIYFQSVLAQNGLDLQPSNTWASSTEISGTSDKVMPGIVSIYGRNDNSTLLGLDEIKITAGSGFFVNSSGYIITNKHVVVDQKSTYSVTLSNGVKKNATVVYRDPNNDLALLKISGKNYPVLKLGDSSKLKIGQSIMGIGNAYGKFSDTVSSGVITGLNKIILAQDQYGQSSEELDNVIKTNANLYPGDSGGPLFDVSGNIIGIDVAAGMAGNGSSFSIPINDAKAIINSVSPGSSI